MMMTKVMMIIIITRRSAVAEIACDALINDHLDNYT